MQAELHLVQVTKGCVKSASIAELFGKLCEAKNGFLMSACYRKDPKTSTLFT